MMRQKRSKLLWLPRRGRLPAPIHSDDIPVVVLHGTLGSPGNFEKLAHTLATNGRRVIGFEYGDRGTAELTVSEREVTEFLRQFELVDVIGHSLGGLMALRAAHTLGNVRTLIGLGAAWRGVPRTRFPRLLEWIAGPAFRQLQQKFPAKVPQNTRVVSINSDSDTVVPAWSSTLGEVITLQGVHHAHLPGQVTEIIKALG